MGIVYFRIELGANCVCILKFAFETLHLNRAEFVADPPLPPLVAGHREPGQDSAH